MDNWEKVITDNVAIRQEILRGLKKNNKDFGHPYCPCVAEYKYKEENHKDYICPCKNFKEEVKIDEECICGLFLKKNKYQPDAEERINGVK